MTQHKVGTRDEWLAARREVLGREKELTRRSDELLPLAYAAGSVWLLLSRPGQLAGRLVHHLRNR